MPVDAVDVIEAVVAARRAENAAREKDKPSARDVSTVIAAIRADYSRDWEREKLAFAKELLSRTMAGIPVAALSVCGRGTQEIRYSSYLAYFLDMGKQHGLGARYLDSLLARVGGENIPTGESVVETEVWLGDVAGRSRAIGCYCDIVITCGDHVVFIENKVKSAESGHPDSRDSQLRRYDAAIDHNPKYATMTQVRLFLTPYGKESNKSPNWQSLSYGELVDAGIDVLRAGGISQTGRDNLKRFLLDLSLGPFDRAEQDIQLLTQLALKAITSDDFGTRLRFDQVAGRNRALVELLLEG